MRPALCNILFRVFGHRICCGQIPEWTAHLGQRWSTYDKAPANLYNVIWRVQESIRRNVD